jgi:hypothetical protein
VFHGLQDPGAHLRLGACAGEVRRVKENGALEAIESVVSLCRRAALSRLGCGSDSVVGILMEVFGHACDAGVSPAFSRAWILARAVGLVCLTLCPLPCFFVFVGRPVCRSLWLDGESGSRLIGEGVPP